MVSKELVRVHQDLVAPVCALEEYAQTTDCSPIIDVISMALRKILEDIENEKYEVKK